MRQSKFTETQIVSILKEADARSSRSSLARSMGFQFNGPDVSPGNDSTSKLE